MPLNDFYSTIHMFFARRPIGPGRNGLVLSPPSRLPSVSGRLLYTEPWNPEAVPFFSITR